MRRQLRGIVTSDKCDKTRRVEVARRYRHPKYGKIVRGKTVCHVHDENNDSAEGDTVDIVECRPMSKLKRWELVSVVKHGLDAVVDVDSDEVKEALGEKTAEEPAAEPVEVEVEAETEQAAADDEDKE
ncbi:MAG: 30S ribosomal protein S17 [Planctomycetota bacterium]